MICGMILFVVFEELSISECWNEVNIRNLENLSDEYAMRIRMYNEVESKHLTVINSNEAELWVLRKNSSQQKFYELRILLIDWKSIRIIHNEMQPIE